VDLSNFSPSQRQKVEAEDRPLAVLAGLGSGKTTVLAGRIAYVVAQRSVPPAAVIAITFTTTAAAALRARVAGVLGSPARELTHPSGPHQVVRFTRRVCHHILRRELKHNFGCSAVSLCSLRLAVGPGRRDFRQQSSNAALCPRGSARAWQPEYVIQHVRRMVDYAEEAITSGFRFAWYLAHPQTDSGAT
jgi:superfamily I DNA/RNA helicase